MSATETGLQNWTHQASDVPSNGLERQRWANDVERAVLARELGLVSIDEFFANYRISGLAGGGYRLKGDVNARIVQSCVVTLEPIPSQLNEEFDAEFWPEGSAAGGQSEGELSVLSEPDVERLDNGVIDAGRIVFETLSSAIDPYPRKDGAKFALPVDAEMESAQASPFAVLANFNTKK